MTRLDSRFRLARRLPLAAALVSVSLLAGSGSAEEGANVLDQVDRKLASWATQEARALLTPAYDPKQSSHLLAMGRILDQEANYGDAAARLTKSCEAAPDDPAPFVFLGEVRLRQDQTAAATEAFQRAAERARKEIGADAKSQKAHYYLGVAEQRLKRYDAAIASLERARELSPNDPMPHYQLGVTRAFQERWQEAVDHLSKAISHNSGLAYAYYYRGLAASRAGRNDLMIADLDRFVTLAPKAPEAERARKIVQSARR